MKGTIDEVIIKISGNVDKNATSNIESLAESLGKLKSSVKGGYNNLNKLATSLETLKKSSKSLETIKANFAGINSVTNALGKLASITSPKGLTKTIKDLEQLPNVVAKITPDTLQNVARVSEQLATSLTPLADKFADIAVGFSSLQALANKYGVSVTKITEGTNKTINGMTTLKRVVNSVKAPFQKLQSVINTFTKKTDKGFDKLISKNKQLVLSLLGTRSIFTATRKAISEYMQMDAELTKETTNLWRALGAQLAPAVEEVLYLFKQAVRVVYSFVYAITGIDLIARANAKAMKSWGSAANSTLGSLQKFDDLNVADFGKGSDDNQLIELDKIDLSPIQWLIDAVKRIKQTLEEAFDTGRWTNVGKAVGGLINDFSTFINGLNVLEKIENVASSLSDFINGLFTDISGADIGNTIETALLIIPRFINTSLKKIKWDVIGIKISDALKEINFETIITEWANRFILLADGLQTAFLNMDTETLANSLSQVIKGVLGSINKFLEIIKWSELGLKIHDIIVDMDWKGIFNTIGNILLNTLAGIGDLIAGAMFGTKFETKSSSIFAGIGATIGGILISVFGSTLFNKLGTLIKKLFKSTGLGKLKSDSKSTSTSGFTIPKASTVLKGLGDLALIIGGVSAIVLAIGELTRIPGFEKYTTSGLSLVVNVFKGLGSIITPLVVLSAGIVGLGFANPLTVLSGIGGLAEIIAGIPILLLAIGELTRISGFEKYTKAGLAIVVDVFNGLSDIMKPLGVLSTIVVGLGIASPILVTSGLLGLAEIVGGVIVLLDKLSELYDNSGFHKIVQDGGKALNMLGSALGEFGGSIIDGFANTATENLDTYAERLSDFMVELKPFLDGVSTLDESSTNSVKNLADAILTITASNVLDGLTSWAKGKKDLSTFANDLATFGPAFANYAKSVEGISSTTLDASTTAAKSIAEFASTLQPHDGLWQKIVGDNKLSAFGDELESFGKSFANYAKSVSNMNFDIIYNSIAAAGYIVTFYETIPKTFESSTNKRSGITTTTSMLTTFGKELVTFGQKMLDYYNKVKSINVNTMDNITGAINSLLSELILIQKYGLSETLTSFSNALNNSSQKITSFFTNALSWSIGYNTGYSFGQAIGSGITSGLKNTKFPSVRLFGLNSNEQIGSYKIQSYATGTNEVPYEGLYHLHEGEAVVPKKYNPAVGGGYSGELDEKIDKLITIVENMETSTIVNLGNKTLYNEQKKYNNFQRNKYGSINI